MAPAKGEGGVAYLRRLLIANGYPKISWLVNSPRLARPAGLRYVASALARLGVSGKRELSRFGGVIERGRNASFNAQSVSAHHLDFRRPKICPCCASERSVRLAEWDLSLWTACPLHGCALIEHCPSCGKRLPRHCSYIECCDSPPHWETAVVQSPSATIDLLRVIARKAKIAAPAPSPALNGLLSCLSLQEALEFTVHLGAAAVTNPERRRKLLRIYGVEKNEISTLVDAAAEALSNWPKGFHLLIERSRNGSPETESTSVAVDFKYFSDECYHAGGGFLGPKLKFIRDEFDRYLQTTFAHWRSDQFARIRLHHASTPGS